MLVSELSRKLDLVLLPPAGGGAEDVELKGVSADSREISPAFLFGALKGSAADGRGFIGKAVSRGAAAVLLEPPDVSGDYFRLVTKKGADLREKLADSARLVYGEPDLKLVTVGVTGTNGKSTTVYLLERVLRDLGLEPGVMGTVDYHWKGEKRKAPNTTPEGPLFYRSLKEMRDAGAKSSIMEISSHALALKRIGALKCSYALFTNLSRDHLDFHRDMEDYFSAKKKLFTDHLKDQGSGPRAAVNADDPYGERLKAELKEKALSYGFRKGEARGRILEESRNGIKLEARINGGKYLIESGLLGAFNAENLLGAFALASLISDRPDFIAESLSAAEGAPGRMSRVGRDPRYLVLVDYAHSPGALEKVVSASLRLLGGRGRLLCLFGCGGDRDRGKRPEMAKAAALAHLPLLTSDNPRTEDPERILDDAEKGLIAAGLKRASHEELKKGFEKGVYLREPDRGKALRLGADLLEKDDVFLVTGKGHEDYQIVGRETRPFDDSLISLEALRSFHKDG
ncbi:MAG: UDP-N-acetylmuramoyl-L-alanyl-D-glutamate--2,6-diaminopimelate ligase [Deltaproteobacteria bacterium]|jgi:UDP-N-acetylmuramoyl-L-alanyl-D-glutamate--2,6-diaminopimelate ligase|nr:UDP-N-acetylmuramoyl-L-alanyl-D-glutamate--2,6-diaminopimelate ligase [Deltaproteobacteria bacterium]